MSPGEECRLELADRLDPHPDHPPRLISRYPGIHSIARIQNVFFKIIVVSRNLHAGVIRSGLEALLNHLGDRLVVGTLRAQDLPVRGETCHV